MMRALSRRSFTEYQQSAIWSLWSQGKSLSEIGRQLDKHAGSIFCFLQKYGGIKPVKPIRSKQALTLNEREEISRGLSAHLSIRNIAKSLNRSSSTIPIATSLAMGIVMRLGRLYRLRVRLMIGVIRYHD